MKKITFVIELDRCIGCKGCQVACKVNNEVALGSCRNPVKTIGPTGVYPDIQLYFLPSMCQQCENPVCTEVCPTGACFQNEDGIIRIDRNLCIGCKSCAHACPYEANTYNQERMVMDKCDTCIARREQGLEPACVMNCCGHALHVGDINDPESEVSRLLREAGAANVHTLRDFGNRPSVRYILKNAEWQDVLPQDCSEPRRGNKKK